MECYSYIGPMLKSTKMERRTKSTIRKQIEYSVVEYQSEVIDGKKMDTKVILNDQFLCCIAGNTIFEFHENLVKLINDFKI